MGGVIREGPEHGRELAADALTLFAALLLAAGLIDAAENHLPCPGGRREVVGACGTLDRTSLLGRDADRRLRGLCPDPDPGRNACYSHLGSSG